MMNAHFLLTHTGKLRPSSTLLLFTLLVFLTSGFSDCGGNTPPVKDGFDPRFYDLGLSTDPPSVVPDIAASVVDPFNGFIYVGGRFDTRGNTATANIARYSPLTNEWSALGGGGLVGDPIDGTAEPVVQALAIQGRHLYVGGRFRRTADGSVTCRNIARYNLASGTWEPLQGGGLSVDVTNGAVRALAVAGNHLFVGGQFEQTADGSMTGMANIAKYGPLPGAGWSPLAGGGLNGSVYALLLWNNRIWVGGQFSDTSANEGFPLHNIASYPPIGDGWFGTYNEGLNGRVTALAADSSFLYVGGDFDGTYDETIQNLNHIANFYPPLKIWSPLFGNGLSHSVKALAVTGNTVFAGGNFTQTADATTTGLNRVAQYNRSTGTWSSLPGGGLNNTVKTFALSGESEVYIGGSFWGSSTPNTAAYSGVVRYQFAPPARKPAAPEGPTGSLSQLGPNRGLALNGKVRALAADAQGYVYAGGEFTAAADGTQLKYIARFDPSSNSWSPLAANGVGGVVNALAVSGDDLYVAGNFFGTGDNATQMRFIGRYNLTTNTWFPLSHQGVNALPRALAVARGKLFVGGQFTSTFDDAVPNLNYLAKYDLATGTWSPVTGNGLNSFVLCMAAAGDQVFAGGFFDQTFTGSTTNLRYAARYHAGTNTWSALANGGLNSFVLGLTVSDNYLVARGEFTATADNTVGMNQVGIYDYGPGTWAPVTSGTDVVLTGPKVLASVRAGSELYVGGEFRGFGDRAASYFTRIYLQQWKTPAPGSDWFDGANWTTGAVPASNTNAVIPAGAGNVNITAADVTVKDLMLNGGALNVGAGRTLTITGVLGLAGGVVTGEGTVVVTNCRPDAVVGGNDASYLRGTLIRCVDNTGTFNFPVGTANGFSPVTVKDVTGTGTVSIKAQQGVYPGPAAGLPVNRLARWWQIENPGGGITGSKLAFNYRPGDASGENLYQAYRITGGTASPVAGSINAFTHQFLTGPITGFSDWTLAGPTPTAVSISGRVVSSTGNGVSKVVITLTDLAGISLTTTTSPFGYYLFDNVAGGETYVVSARHKRFGFEPGELVVNGSSDVANADFVQVGIGVKPPPAGGNRSRTGP